MQRNCFSLGVAFDAIPYLPKDREGAQKWSGNVADGGEPAPFDKDCDENGQGQAEKGGGDGDKSPQGCQKCSHMYFLAVSLRLSVCRSVSTATDIIKNLSIIATGYRAVDGKTGWTRRI
jgi:hypothetical protein